VFNRVRMLDLQSFSQTLARWWTPSSFKARCYLCAVIAICWLVTFLWIDVLSSTKAPPHPARESPVVWRKWDRDAVNCLYLKARLLGLNIDYDRLIRETPPVPTDNLHDIEATAESYDCPTEAVKLTYDELCALDTPTITYIESEGENSGKFILVYDIGDNQVQYIDGGSVCTVRSSTESFRRAWSGYSLIVSPKTSLWHRWVIFAAESILLYSVARSIVLFTYTIRRRTHASLE
jgi:hypothetical protein